MNKSSFHTHHYYFLLTFIMLLFLRGIIPAQQKQQTCNVVNLKFTLKAGESFQQKIGNLAFCVKTDPEKERGWRFSLEDEVGRDYIAPVNLPLRFNASQDLGPGYGKTALESLKGMRELRFLINESDYKRLDPLWKNALWPYNAPDSDHAGGIFLDAIKRSALGMLRLRIMNADISPNDAIRSASFEVEFVAPSQFSFNASLSPNRSTCPPPFDW
jgi:hypothetical protein